MGLGMIRKFQSIAHAQEMLDKLLKAGSYAAQDLLDEYGHEAATYFVEEYGDDYDEALYVVEHDPSEWPHVVIERFCDALDKLAESEGLMLEPKMITPLEATPDSLRKIPNLGDYEPTTWWDLEERLFVDSSGFGLPGEPALTFDQFVRQAQEIVEERGPRGFAIVETGQFQPYVGVFKRAE